jgi:hypothetical protein
MKKFLWSLINDISPASTWHGSKRRRNPISCRKSYEL